MTDTASIYLERKPEYADRGRKYKIYLDDKYVGDISRDETKKFEVSPGDHRIMLKIDWVSSNTLVFNAHINDDIYLECGNNCGFPFNPRNLLKFALAATLVRSSYLYVKRR